MKNNTTPPTNTTNLFAVFEGMETEAKKRKQSVPEYLLSEFPDLADVIRRMLEAELRWRKNNKVHPTDCERCKLLNIPRQVANSNV